jgi:hypothetical protein
VLPRGRRSLPSLAPHKLCVETAGLGRIFDALDDGTAILEDHDLGVALREADQVLVCDDPPRRREAPSQAFEVDLGPPGRPHLDRVPPAQDSGQSPRARLERLVAARDASGTARGFPGEVHDFEEPRPEIHGYDAGQEGLGAAGEDLQSLAGLDPRDDVDDGCHDSGGVAGRSRARGGDLLEDAAQARRDPRPDQEREAVRPDARAVDPRDPLAHAEVVHHEARLEVVGSVEDEVRGRHPLGPILGCEIRNDGLKRHL